jgi:type VI secretion system secreted protein VgrG
MPHLPRAEIAKHEIEFRYFTDWGEAVASRPFKAFMSDGTVRTGKLDAEGYARLSDVAPGTTARIEYQRDVNPAKSLVSAELDDDVKEFFNASVKIHTGAEDV